MQPFQEPQSKRTKIPLAVRTKLRRCSQYTAPLRLPRQFGWRGLHRSRRSRGSHLHLLNGLHQTSEALCVLSLHRFKLGIRGDLVSAQILHSYLKEIEAISTPAGRTASPSPPWAAELGSADRPSQSSAKNSRPGRVVEEASASSGMGCEARGGKQVTSSGEASRQATSPKVHDSHPVGASPLLPGREFSFCLWASSLVRLVLKSEIAFGHFLKTTLPLCRDSSLGAATALFPLPLPHDGLFVKRSRRRSLKWRLPHLVRVALHVLVMSLNFLHANGKHIPPDCLRRPPSELQATAPSRLTELIKACVRLGGTTLQAGRRGL